ncbi:hypothetical protein [Limosilactobacillus fermentum]|uniref:hypothetical protein n=1 Tax=Limosilactobacillus fermentum TaxID=1613 RepID=UPI00210FB8D6|nr:hypothetical protein [Limosilactobacillus fermentum]UUC15470.1 hypothetical protein NOV98_00505 [Limosilactobacillus fermentum]
MQLRFKDSYVWFLSLVVAYYSFILYANGAQLIKSYISAIDSVLTVGLVLIGCLNVLLQKDIHLVQDIVFILFLAVIVIFFHQMSILQIAAVVIAFLPTDPLGALKAYRNGILISIIVTFLFGFFYGMHNTTTYDGVFTFGFTNENQTGYYFAFIAMCSLFIIEDRKIRLNVNWQKVVMYVIILLLNYILFQDNTVTISMAVFVLLVMFNHMIWRWMLMISIILAPILTYASYWIAMNYYSGNWLFELNKVFTMRPVIWNYFFTRYPIQLTKGNPIVVGNIGFEYTPGQGAFDGTYAYLLYSYGILFTIIVILGLSLATYQLIQSKNNIILYFLICLELVGFSENILYSYSLSFGIIFAFLAYRFTWFQKEKGIELVNETKSN